MPFMRIKTRHEGLRKQCAVLSEFLTAGISKELQQVFHSELFLFFSPDIQNNPSVVHHDQPVAVLYGIHKKMEVRGEGSKKAFSAPAAIMKRLKRSTREKASI